MKAHIPDASLQSLTRPGAGKKRIYLYPITPFMYKKGSNDYILRVKESLNQEFAVVNNTTRLGIVDILLKLPKCDIIYFNWIADIVDRRFGYLQIILLLLILTISKISGIKIVWFIHNDISHSARNFYAKKLVGRMMRLFADVSLSHSNELSYKNKISSLQVFDHPVEERQHISTPISPDYDVLIWGSVSPYKGVLDFAGFNHSTDKLNTLKILVAGKFISLKLYHEMQQYNKFNIEIVNKTLEESELIELFSRSKYVLFCYQSSSVLSSGALCKSLSFGKTIIGPDIGAFKELGQKGLIYTYNSFEELADILVSLKRTGQEIDKNSIRRYIQNTRWNDFSDFLVQTLSDEKKHRFHLLPAILRKGKKKIPAA